MSRVICWFSCGAASAVATKLALVKYPHAEVVREWIAEEHPDNDRFARDCAKWFGRGIINITSNKYKGSVHEVIRQERYVSNASGAPCTRELKRKVRQEYSRADDIHVFGYCADEQDRWDNFLDNNNDICAEAPLIDACLTHDETLTIVRDNGIELPAMYKLGYRHNNCIGCAKATGAGYWNMIRRDFPPRFQQMAELSESVGARLTRVNGKRIFLRELPEGYGNYSEEPEPQCGAFCDAAKQVMREAMP